MKILILLLLFFYTWTFAATKPQQLLSDSEQLIIVLAKDGDTTQGQMQRFARTTVKSAWNTVGKPIPIVIGKQGMAWDFHFKNNSDYLPIKTEGDNRTPIGVYALGPLFDFDEKIKYKKNYFPLTNASICVDDVKSNYYNQLIDGNKVKQKDWHSGEKMRQVPQYKLGAIIQYNAEPTTKGAGSCIFMHIWKSPEIGTAGCIAMAEVNLKETLTWLDPKKKPLIAIFPTHVFKTGETKWKLPNMLYNN